MVEDSAFSNKIDIVKKFKEILNLKGHPNRITGSKVTRILLNGCILPGYWWSCITGCYILSKSNQSPLLVITSCFRLTETIRDRHRLKRSITDCCIQFYTVTDHQRLPQVATIHHRLSHHRRSPVVTEHYRLSHTITDCHIQSETVTGRYNASQTVT